MVCITIMNNILVQVEISDTAIVMDDGDFVSSGFMEEVDVVADSSTPVVQLSLEEKQSCIVQLTSSNLCNVIGKQITMQKSASRSYGGHFCCVPGCSNQRTKDKARGVSRSYYRLPANKAELARWLKLIRRDNWVPRSWDRICSDHFAGGLLSILSTV